MKHAFVMSKTLAASLLVTLAVFCVLAIPSTAHAQETAEPEQSQVVQGEQNEENLPQPNSTNVNIQQSLCAGANLETGTNCQTQLEEGKNANEVLNDLIADIINIFSFVVGVVAVIMIIVGGFRYITSGGDSANVGAAKNTILYAIIGLVIVALSQFIVRFILGRVIL